MSKEHFAIHRLQSRLIALIRSNILTRSSRVETLGQRFLEFVVTCIFALNLLLYFLLLISTYNIDNARNMGIDTATHDQTTLVASLDAQFSTRQYTKSELETMDHSIFHNLPWSSLDLAASSSTPSSTYHHIHYLDFTIYKPFTCHGLFLPPLIRYRIPLPGLKEPCRAACSPQAWPLGWAGRYSRRLNEGVLLGEMLSVGILWWMGSSVWIERGR